MSNIMTPHNLEMFLKKVVLESGGTITLISNNLRIHLVKQGETVKQKAMTTGCSLEDSIWIEGKSLLEIWPALSQVTREATDSINWGFHTQLGKPYVAWALDSLEVLFKGLTRWAPVVSYKS